MRDNEIFLFFLLLLTSYLRRTYLLSFLSSFLSPPTTYLPAYDIHTDRHIHTYTCADVEADVQGWVFVVDVNTPRILFPQQERRRLFACELCFFSLRGQPRRFVFIESVRHNHTVIAGEDDEFAKFEKTGCRSSGSHESSG